MNKLETFAAEAMKLADNNVKRAAPKLISVLLQNINRPWLILLGEDYLSRLPLPVIEEPAPVKPAPAPAAVKAAVKAAPVIAQAAPVIAHQPAAPIQAAPTPAQAAPDPVAGIEPPAPLAAPAAEQAVAADPPAPGLAKPFHSRRREGAHRRPAKLPTPGQQAAALKAKKVVYDAIFQRKIRGGKMIGDVRIHELPALAQSHAATAGSFSQRGYDDGVDAIVFTMVQNHCVAADPFGKVADTISARALKRIYAEAEIKSAEIMRDAAARTASDLIAGARTPVIEGGTQP
jgi:hypothetical protein